MGNQRNFLLFILISLPLVFGWDALLTHFYPPKHKPAAIASAPASHASGAAPASAAVPAAADPAPAKPTREGGLGSVAEQAAEAKSLTAALAGPRVPVVAPGLSGSINLSGGVLDDLVVNRHKESLAKDSAPTRIYSPAGTPAQQFAQLGWVGAPAGVALPDGATLWTAPAGAKLTPATPVTLSWANTSGQTFTLTYAIDDNYLVSVSQGVANKGTVPLALRPFALINRTDRTASMDSWQLHSGPFGAFDGSVNFDIKYKKLQENGQVANEGKPDWLGFTDIYWMSVLVPDSAATAHPTSSFRALGGGLYRADLLYAPLAVAPGAMASRTTRIFAGAKESDVLSAYQAAGIPKFTYAIDWGWFWFTEKPILALLLKLFHMVGNFGLAIIILTLIVRGVMFPVAQRQFASMASMRAIQPKMKALQERYKDDRQKLQEETMKLYKEEGVNPLAGCLPIFLQIPIFFALYKVLSVAVEMRHQPFVGWLKDLSAPDPMHILNLFGLLPFEPPAMLGLGVLGLLLGVTMWLQFRMQPAAPDPAQQQVMSIMPWMMMFVMSPFAAGLLLYYIMNNLISVAQQSYLYARHPQMRAMVEKERADVTRAAHPGS